MSRKKAMVNSLNHAVTALRTLSNEAMKEHCGLAHDDIKSALGFVVRAMATYQNAADDEEAMPVMLTRSQVAALKKVLDHAVDQDMWSSTTQQKIQQVSVELEKV